MEKALLDSLDTLLGVGGAALAWLLADARSKARLQYGEERMTKLEAKLEKGLDLLAMQNERCDSEHSETVERVAAAEVRLAKFDQSQTETIRSIDKLEAGKASKELLEALRIEIQQVKLDIDKRFDKLERILDRK